MQFERCGFAAIIGAPNAGKSTLVNTLVGAKVSIVSPKVQTTRSRVLGITVSEQSQILLVDTPGIFSPRDTNRLDRAMVDAAWSGARDADIVLFLYDASRKSLGPDNDAILSALENFHGKPRILVLNKIDRISPETLLDLTAKLNDRIKFDKTFMISALKGNGVDDLQKTLGGMMPEGPWLYPEDQITDAPLKILAAEITREKLFIRLQQEVPYDIAVLTENWERFDNGSIKVEQVVYVARDSQKGIVLGKGGSMIKAVGEEARRDLSRLLDEEIHLKLYVKVNSRWRDDPDYFRLFGLEFNAR